MKSLANALADLQYTLKEICGNNQNEALCALGKLAEPQRVNIFRRKFYEPSFSHLPILRKAPKWLWYLFLRNNNGLLLRCVIDWMYPLLPNHIYTGLSPYLFRRVLRAFLNTFSWVIILRLGRIKFCMSFLDWLLIVCLLIPTHL